MKEEENERGNGEEEPEVVRGEERITLTLCRVSEGVSEGEGQRNTGENIYFTLL